MPEHTCRSLEACDHPPRLRRMFPSSCISSNSSSLLSACLQTEQRTKKIHSHISHRSPRAIHTYLQYLSYMLLNKNVTTKLYTYLYSYVNKFNWNISCTYYYHCTINARLNSKIFNLRLYIIQSCISIFLLKTMACMLVYGKSGTFKLSVWNSQ